jgi:hypothetical protein
MSSSDQKNAPPGPFVGMSIRPTHTARDNLEGWTLSLSATSRVLKNFIANSYDIVIVIADSLSAFIGICANSGLAFAKEGLANC